MTHPPTFVLAAPRSGSTVFFELFGSHRDFAWVTNYEEKFRRLYCGGVLRQLLERKYWHISGGKKEYVARQWYNRTLPKPSEGYEFWTRETDADFHRSWLWTTRANAQTSCKLQRITARIQFWQGRPRLAHKFTGPGRIGYLQSLYPDARFIHLVRDPYAQIRSLLKVGFWNRGGGMNSSGGITTSRPFCKATCSPRKTPTIRWPWLPRKTVPWSKAFAAKPERSCRRNTIRKSAMKISSTNRATQSSGCGKRWAWHRTNPACNASTIIHCAQHVTAHCMTNWRDRIKIRLLNGYDGSYKHEACYDHYRPAIVTTGNRL